MRKIFAISLTLLLGFYLWLFVCIGLEIEKTHDLFSIELDELAKSL